MDEELLQKLNNQDWDAILLELMAYAVWLCQVKHNKNIPGSIEPEELVMAVIDKVYAGERKWNPDTDPDLAAYLKSVVKSHLSNKLSTGHPENYEETDENRSDRSWHEREEELYFRKLDETVIKLMEGDTGVCLVYKGLKDGLKPEAIADEYGVDIKLVRNAQRRLRTIILKVLPSERPKKLQTHESR
jgi:hypothetical protein